MSERRGPTVFKTDRRVGAVRDQLFRLTNNESADDFAGLKSLSYVDILRSIVDPLEPSLSRHWSPGNGDSVSGGRHEVSFGELDFETFRGFPTLSVTEGGVVVLDQGSVVNVNLAPQSTLIVSPIVDVVNIREAPKYREIAKDSYVVHHSSTTVRGALRPGGGANTFTYGEKQERAILFEALGQMREPLVDMLFERAIMSQSFSPEQVEDLAKETAFLNRVKVAIRQLW